MLSTKGEPFCYHPPRVHGVVHQLAAGLRILWLSVASWILNMIYRHPAGSYQRNFPQCMTAHHFAICKGARFRQSYKLFTERAVAVKSGGRHLERNHCVADLHAAQGDSWVIIIPPAQRSCWGGILVSLRPSVRPSVRLSVRPSVRPSVPHAVSALYHLQLWMDSFHIRPKWSLPWEGVSRTMTFDLDLYLQGRSALT